MSIVIIGDTHGNLKFLIDLVDLYPKQTNFIQVGDFGIGFPRMNPNETLKHLENALQAQQSLMYVVRGNHDDPNFFDGTYMNSNLKFIPDYSLIEIENKQVLFIGGGISLDRKYRTPFISYWPNEGVKFNQEALNKINKVDIVISHTAPHFCHPVKINQFVKDWMAVDNLLITQLPAERKIMTQIFEYLTKDKGLKIPKWFYGHFHCQHMLENHCGTMFKVLNINEIIELKNDVAKNKKVSRKSSK